MNGSVTIQPASQMPQQTTPFIFGRKVFIFFPSYYQLCSKPAPVCRFAQGESSSASRHRRSLRRPHSQVTLHLICMKTFRSFKRGFGFILGPVALPFSQSNYCIITLFVCLKPIYMRSHSTRIPLLIFQLPSEKALCHWACHYGMTLFSITYFPLKIPSP